MTYRIVIMVKRQMVIQEPKDIEFWASVCGVEILGYNENPRHRAELQGQPILDGFRGPMWDGGAIRYESQEVYNALSA